MATVETRNGNIFQDARGVEQTAEETAEAIRYNGGRARVRILPRAEGQMENDAIVDEYVYFANDPRMGGEWVEYCRIKADLRGGQ